MYVLTERGEKLEVDNSQINYDEGWHPWYQNCVVIDDDSTYLKDVWIVELQAMNSARSFKYFSMEWAKDVYFDHEPSKDEILRAIIASGGGIDTVAFVRHGFVMDRDYD